MQEDALFLHEVLKIIFAGDELYNQLFEDLNSFPNLKIAIQKNSKDIKGFKHIYAVSLSETEMTDFWAQTRVDEYDPICDLVLTINDVCIVIEAKRDCIDCTAQLYNQIFNILRKDGLNLDDCRDKVTDRDLNWSKLMTVAVKVSSFERMSGNKNRFLTDFIKLIKDHNPNWLPATPIGSLNSINADAIYRRVRMAVEHFETSKVGLELLSYNDRLGTTFSKSWANEVLFHVTKEEDLVASIYPGNTKGQGWHIFHKDPEFNQEVVLNGKSYPVSIGCHIKFSGQGYVTGLWFDEDKLKKKLYTQKNFQNKTGRYSKENWHEIEALLDEHLDYDWRKQCDWKSKILDSNRTVINFAIGYVVELAVPRETLRNIDTQIQDIGPLTKLLGDIYDTFENDLIKS
ncbi:hypothetical protein HWV00_08005 [Moritella sp. 24]|uniref:hypothetical protein n=1 Tax=Moritella sp. 24 TaxID=2746230 RepID=UPI001BA79DCB|nr:hypothetical protein [Moritella sp. 24]QUM76167.1 hypothetical protein HWV00_08005 [Moritella sp. 24]